jgi:hypothetical protein
MTTRIIGFLLIVAAIGLAISTVYLYGHTAGRDACQADQNKQDATIRAAVDAATRTSAEAIREIKIVHRTVQQRVEREIQTNTVFRDCRLPDGVRDDINAAIAGRPVPAASGVVPPTDSAGR